MKNKIITVLLALALFATFAEAYDTKYIKASAAKSGLFCDYANDTAVCAREWAVDIAVEAASVPAAVGIASAVGTTASTGTAIASLSGAAATSATLAAIGSSSVGAAATAGAAAVGIVAAPAVVGGVIVLGVGAGLAYGINWLFE